MLKSAIPKKFHLKTLDVLYLISAPFLCGRPRGAHNYSGAPRTRERRPIAKKIWYSIHPRKFGYNVRVRPPVHSLGFGFIFGAKLTILRATNGVARVKL